MTAYKMGIDPDAAENLAKEVGEELATAVLEKVRKKIEYQASLKFHAKKKPNDWFFGQEARNCRLEFRAGKKKERQSTERREYTQKSHESYEKGYRPTVDTLYGQLEDDLEDSEKVNGASLTYEDFQKAKRFLDSLEE